MKLTSDATARVIYTLPAAAELNVQANVTARERDTVVSNSTATGTETAPQLVDLIVKPTVPRTPATRSVDARATDSRAAAPGIAMIRAILNDLAP